MSRLIAIAIAVLIAAAPAPLCAQAVSAVAAPRLEPAYVYPPEPILPSGDFPRTAIDLRSAGVTGSAGYMCTGDRHPLDAHESNMAAASRFDRQRSFLGAKLSFAFH